MKCHYLKIGFHLLLLAFSCISFADQPVMNEVPRWSNGYGFQVFQEFRWSNDLMSGDTSLPNPENLRYAKRITHLEGVYTWRKWIRMTAKLPWVDQKRRVIDEHGTVRWERNRGLDDVKLAMPLRYYTNRPRYSGHIGIVPQVRFGGDQEGAYPISDGSSDFGMSMTFERETSSIKISGDMTYWWEQEADEENDWSIDIEMGWNFHDRGSINWETEYINNPGDYKWLGVGPTFFWNFNDVVLGRIEYKVAIDEEVEATNLSQGDSFRIGLGVIF